MAVRFATLIASCALNVGDTLPNKRDLAVTMGVSREITRGALLILSTKSLVIVVQGSRTKIASGDPARFGLIIVVHLALGMITPPPGVNLLAACSVANLQVEKIIPQLVWFVLTVFAARMVITYVPAITLWPVEWVFGE